MTLPSYRCDRDHACGGGRHVFLMAPSQRIPKGFPPINGSAECQTKCLPKEEPQSLEAIGDVVRHAMSAAFVILNSRDFDQTKLNHRGGLLSRRR